MQIFELLDQYEGICRRAFFGCSAKLNKTFKANIIELLILIMGDVHTAKDKLSSAWTLRATRRVTLQADLPQGLRLDVLQHEPCRRSFPIWNETAGNCH